MKKEIEQKTVGISSESRRSFLKKSKYAIYAAPALTLMVVNANAACNSNATNNSNANCNAG